MTDTPKLWERQEYDTDKSYEGFLAYRRLGTQRSIDKAYTLYKTGAKQLQEGDEILSAPGYFQKWSSDYNWVDRYQAYVDSLSDAVAQADTEWYIEEKAKARRRIQKLGEAIDKMLRDGEKVEWRGYNPGVLNQLAGAIKTNNDEMQRLAGEPHRYNDNQAHDVKHSGEVTVNIPPLPQRVRDKFADE